MRKTAAVLAYLLAASAAAAAEPTYIDQLMEAPVTTLQSTFAGLKKEGCYRIGEDRYVMVTIDAKDQKPWRIFVTSMPPCRRPETGPAIDLRLRSGVELGQSQLEIVERLGRPDTADPPEHSQRRLGDIEYFYLCRVSDMCARHTSIFVRDGVVTAFGEWYSE